MKMNNLNKISYATAPCSMGNILIAQSAKGICAIFMGDNPDDLVQHLQKRFPRDYLTREHQQLEQLVATIHGLLESPSLAIELPLDLRGTVFQLRVWQALKEIPAGSTVSYTDIATRIGSPKSVRAVAQACGANPIAVIIPCHRVVKRDGSLSGYRWGVQRKQMLLNREL